MRRSQLVALALAISLASGCGNESITGSATNPAEGIYGYLRDIVTRARVGDPDLRALVSAACDAYADGLQVRQRGADLGSFVDYITDLLNVSGGGQEQARVDNAVTKACGSFDGDVRRFVDDLSASLDIGLAELRGFVASACADFNANATDPHGPEPFDPMVSSIFAEGGLDRTELGALVDEACRDSPPPAREDDAILPNPELTPGDTSAPGELETWCRSGYVENYPPITDAARESVFDAYGVAHDKRASYAIMRLIPTGLGGTNAKANLFPVSRVVDNPNADDKVEIDRRLTALVCAGRHDLEAARANLIRQWPTALAQAVGPGSGNAVPIQTLPLRP